jgi:plastocyanin
MKRLVTSLGLIALAVLAAACSPAAAAPSEPAGSPAAGTLQISAKDLKFSTDQLTAPAGKPFAIQFDNQEPAPHNVSIYRDEALSDTVFVQDPFGGPATQTYAIPALEAGSYVFVCDVHKEMRGTLTAE